MISLNTLIRDSIGDNYPSSKIRRKKIDRLVELCSKDKLSYIQRLDLLYSLSTLIVLEKRSSGDFEYNAESMFVQLQDSDLNDVKMIVESLDSISN